MTLSVKMFLYCTLTGKFNHSGNSNNNGSWGDHQITQGSRKACISIALYLAESQQKFELLFGRQSTFMNSCFTFFSFRCCFEVFTLQIYFYLLKIVRDREISSTSSLAQPGMAQAQSKNSLWSITWGTGLRQLTYHSFLLRMCIPSRKQDQKHSNQDPEMAL